MTQHYRYTLQVPAGVRSKDRASYTLPAGLSIRTSGIPNAGLGVWADKFFPSRTQFGPYGGIHEKDIDKAHASGYCWQVRDIGRKEGNVLFNDTLNTFYLVIWRQTYGKGPLRKREETRCHPTWLLFPISSKGSFICIIPQTG